MAVCPHCDTGVPGSPNYSPQMRHALMTWDCANCGGEWREVRTPTGSERFWVVRQRVLTAR